MYIWTFIQLSNHVSASQCVILHNNAAIGHAMTCAHDSSFLFLVEGELDVVFSCSAVSLECLLELLYHSWQIEPL